MKKENFLRKISPFSKNSFFSKQKSQQFMSRLWRVL